MLLQLQNLTLLRPEDGAIAVHRGDIYIEDGLVRYTAPGRTPHRVIDAQGALALPGLVNAHHHIYSALATGLSPGKPLRDFEGILGDMWWRLDQELDEESVRLCALLAARDCLRCGVTTVFDHHVSVPFVEGSLHTLDRELRQQGVNAVLCWEATGRYGEELFACALAQSVSFAAETGRGMLGMHASFTLEEHHLRQVAAASPDVPVHIHVAEGAVDEQQCRERYGVSVVERLRRHGLLRPGSLLVHGCHLADDELAAMAAADVWLAQAVESNRNNALPPLDLTRALQQNVKLCAGTDGLGSDVLASIRAAFWQHRLAHRDPDAGWDVAAAMFHGNYELKQQWGFPLGVRPDEPADIAIFHYTPAGTVDAANALGHVLYGLAGSAARWVVQADRLSLDESRPTAPLPEIYQRREAITRALWNRFIDQERP